MVFLAPSLARILDAATRWGAGKATAEEVQEAFPEAAQFVAQGVQMFEMLHSGILRTDETEELIRQIRLEHQAQVEALKLLDEAVKEKRPQSLLKGTEQLRSSSTRLLELFGRLQEKEHTELVYSPYPVIDHFVKTGINLLNGHLEPVALQDRVAPVAALVQGLRGEAERFGLLYEQEALAGEARKWLEQMEAGLGAAMAWLQETSNKKVLEDSCKLLGAGSVQLAQVLARFDQTAAQSAKFSRHRVLEELARAHQGSFPPELKARVQTAVQELLGAWLRELEGLRLHPLANEMDIQMQEAHSAWEAARRALEAGGQFAELDAAFTALAEKLLALRARLEEESVKYGGAPHLARLREVIGRALAGTLPKSELKASLGQYKEQHQSLVDQLQADAGDPVTAELLTFLAAHGAAFQRMELFLEDGDQEHLRQGWQLIAVTLPRVMELSAQLRERFGLHKPDGGPSQVTCLRCGTGNHHDQRYCKQCNAILPKVNQSVTEYTEITGGPELDIPQANPGPANLVALEQICRAAEASQLSRQEVGILLDKMLANADRTRQNFEKQVIGLMGRDSTFDAYAQFFAIKMNLFVQGLMQMRTFADGAQLSALLSGLAACKEAGEELEVFQERIQKALKGR